MIDFELTEDQKGMKEMARKFTEKEIKPIAARIDNNPEHKFCWDIFHKMAANNFLRMVIPEKYGGLGLDRLTTAVITEELASGCAGITIVATGNTIVALPIIKFGTEEQKERFLPLLCNTQEAKLCAYALTEPGAGSDVSKLGTTATLTAKLEGNYYILNGTKRFITNAPVASLALVFASIDKEKGAKGQGAFLVPVPLPGLTIGKVEDKMGQRAAQNGEMIFEDAPVPKENLLGKEGDGFKIMLSSLDEARPIYTGAVAVGLARAAFDYALKYSKERIQFGNPIFKQQAVSFKLGDMATLIEAARLMVWKACWKMDQNMPVTKEASMSKFYCSDVAVKVTNCAVEILGGYGYVKEFPVEKYLRDSKILQIFEGTNDIQHIILSNFL